MAYSITYPWNREKELMKNRSVFPALLPGLCLTAGVMTLRLLVPETDAVVRQLLHPLTDEGTLEAVGKLMAHLMDGIPVGEAVAAFCLEILNHG